MKDALVPIDQAGRIVLPKGIREELAIKSGDKFKVSVQGTSVTLTPAISTAGFVRKGKALVFSTPGGETISNQTVTDLLEAGRHERETHGLENLPKRKRA